MNGLPDYRFSVLFRGNFSDRANKIYLYIMISQNREFVFIAMLSTSAMVRAYILYPEIRRVGLGFFKRRSDTVGNRLANVEQTVRGKDSPTPPQEGAGPTINTVHTNTRQCSCCKKRGYMPREVLEETPCIASSKGPCRQGRTECFRLTKKDHIIRPGERTAKPADFQELEDQYREGGSNDPLYPRTATPVDPGLSRH